jgi:hypothetical protein
MYKQWFFLNKIQEQHSTATYMRIGLLLKQQHLHNKENIVICKYSTITDGGGG